MRSIRLLTTAFLTIVPLTIVIVNSMHSPVTAQTEPVPFETMVQLGVEATLTAAASTATALNPCPFPTLSGINPTTLWDAARTLRAEESASVIFVASPDLHWDFDDLCWRDVVFNNILAGGVKYYYLYLDTEDNRHKVENMVRDLKQALGNDWQSRVRFIALSDTEFLWDAEYVFYDPYERYATKGQAIIVVIGNPNVWLQPDGAISFRNHFERVWNSQVKDENWQLPPGELSTPEPEATESRANH